MQSTWLKLKNSYTLKILFLTFISGIPITENILNIISPVKIQNLLKNTIQSEISTQLSSSLYNIIYLSYSASLYFIEVLYLLHRNPFSKSELEAMFKFPYSMYSQLWWFCSWYFNLSIFCHQVPNSEFSAMTVFSS